MTRGASRIVSSEVIHSLLRFLLDDLPALPATREEFKIVYEWYKRIGCDQDRLCSPSDIRRVLLNYNFLFDRKKRLTFRKNMIIPAIASSFRCGVCGLDFAKKSKYNKHIKSDNHRMKLDDKSPSITAWFAQNQNNKKARIRKKGAKFCKLCNVDLGNKYNLKQHRSGKKHLRKALAAGMDVALGTERDDVIRISQLDDLYHIHDSSSMAEAEIIVENISRKKIRMSQVTVISDGSDSSLQCSISPVDLVLKRNSPATITVQFSSKNMGFFQRYILLSFNSVKIKAVRKLCVQHGRIPKKLPKQRRKVQYKVRKFPVVKSPVPGEKPPPPEHLQNIKRFLDKYEIPESFRQEYSQFLSAAIIQSTEDTGESDSESGTFEEKKCMEEPQNSLISEDATYVEKMQKLLWLEEMQMERDIKNYDIFNVSFVKERRYLFLEVPGLAERRPSVVHGDRIFVTKSGHSRVYEGFVHIVRRDQIGARFHKDFHKSFKENYSYDVRFSFNRTSLRACHRAIERSEFHDEPEEEISQGYTGKLSLFNSTIETNSQQLTAVREIAFGEYSRPYIVWGPPGTGKTITIVETILQIWKFHPEKRIFAGAPSNSAADLIVMRLASVVSNSEMYRLTAMCRSQDDIDPCVLNYCTYNDSNFILPTDDELRQYRIIVSTCSSSSYIYSVGINTGEFDFVFIDEAGQSMEPECLIPITSLITPSKGRIVLAGDHQQLGPIIQSKQAIEYGLDRSLLENRVSLGSVHKRQLTQNYRSHESILSLYSDLFYESTLEYCSSPEKVNDFVGWEHLPNPNIPIIFHGVNGKDLRHADSPSWFNDIELTVVLEYVIKLLHLDYIDPKDIGIITPYREQVKRIRIALKEYEIDTDELSVGSVEQFQGQEKRIIILSTVRSTGEHRAFDRTFHIGFLDNAKRVNVAISRAKSLLIIVGNPAVLSSDETWRSLLSKINDFGAWCGEKFPDDEKRGSSSDDIELDAAIAELADHFTDDFEENKADDFVVDDDNNEISVFDDLDPEEDDDEHFDFEEIDFETLEESLLEL